MSKADVSVNIVCFLKAVASGHVVTAMCSIGDEQGQYVKAHEGQWLCEDYDGKWTVTDEPPAL